MREKVLRLGIQKNLVGILTEPVARSGDSPAFVLLNAGILHRVGPNRLYVEIARSLAQQGLSALRFDISGLGDSDVRLDRLPYHQSRIGETREAMDFLQAEMGIDQFVTLGLCSGADHAFRLACADERVVGAVLLDGYAYRTRSFYLYHYGPRLIRIEGWWNLLTGKHPLLEALGRKVRSLKSPSPRERTVERFVIDSFPRKEAESRIQQLIDRDVHLLFVYSGGMRHVYEYSSQFQDMFPSIRLDRRVQVRHFPKSDHAFSPLSARKRLIEGIGDWAAASFPHGKRPKDSVDTEVGEVEQHEKQG